MRTILLIFITNLFTWSLVFSTSLKTNDTVSLSNIRILLGIYKENHGGNFPKNWQAFIDSGILSGPVIEDARKYLDIENRYQFINIPTLVTSSGKVFRIIIMANGPGGEGDREKIVENGRAEKSPGRYLIIETDNGMIENRRYSETELSYIFEKAKLNLKDFTIASPPLPELTPPPKESNSEGVALGGPVNPSDDNPIAADKPSKRESKPRSTHSENGIDSIGSSAWQIWIISGLATFGVFALAWSVRRFFLSKSLRKNDDQSK